MFKSIQDAAVLQGNASSSRYESAFKGKGEDKQWKSDYTGIVVKELSKSFEFTEFGKISLPFTGTDSNTTNTSSSSFEADDNRCTSFQVNVTTNKSHSTETIEKKTFTTNSSSPDNQQQQQQQQLHSEQQQQFKTVYCDECSGSSNQSTPSDRTSKLSTSISTADKFPTSSSDARTTPKIYASTTTSASSDDVSGTTKTSTIRWWRFNSTSSHNFSSISNYFTDSDTNPDTSSNVGVFET